MATSPNIDANVVITAVKPDAEAKRLKWFRIHLPDGPLVGGAVDDVSREAVISAIEVDRKKVRTAVERDGKWVIGAEVGVVAVAESKYLRTDKNAVAEDNLGELPIIDTLMQGRHVFKV